MSPAAEEFHTMDNFEFQPDPLLKSGSFIDPNPPSNCTSKPEPLFENPTQLGSPQSSNQIPGSDPYPGGSPSTDRPDWLPPGWSLVERVRASGASAGTRDKYYFDPVSSRRFRSKKEVLLYLETGTIRSKKMKTPNSDADNVPQNVSVTPNQKRRKIEAEVKENFNFDDVPAKVKWELMDVYEEGSWRPLVNGVERVPESSKQDWASAFTYLSLQNSGK